MYISNDQKRVRKTSEIGFSVTGASWYLIHFDYEEEKLITAGYQGVSVFIGTLFYFFHPEGIRKSLPSLEGRVGDGCSLN